MQDVSPEQRLKSSAIHDIARTVEEFADVEFQSGVLEDAHRPALVEFNQHIDVASRASFAPCYRTEHRGV